MPIQNQSERSRLTTWFLGVPVVLILISPSAQADEPSTPRQVEEAIQQYKDATEEYQRRRRDIKSSEERAKLRSQLMPQLADAQGTKMVDWAAGHAEHPLAMPALRLVMEHGTVAAAKQAVRAVTDNHLDIKGEEFRQMVMSLHSVQDAAPEVAEQCLRAFIRRADDTKTRGVACWMLAIYKAEMVHNAGLIGTEPGRRIPKHRVAYLQQLDCEAAVGEAMLLLDRVQREFGNHSIQMAPGKTATLAQIAARDAQRVQGLLKTAIGKPAPEIVGVDVNGKQLKLSEFQGKVVVVNFWSTNCAPCLRLIPDEKRIVEKYQDEPFELLGVNLDADRQTAAETVAKHGITWPNWWIEPGEQDRVAAAWNVQFRPAIYVLDKKGVIRSAHLRGEKLTEAIEQLLREPVEE